MGNLTAVMTLSALRAGYGNQPVTPSITGHILPGCMLAVVGDNGCGKSTLLKTVAGFQPTVSGQLNWPLGRPIIGWLAQRQTLEMQFPVIVQDVVSMGLWPARSLFQRLRSQDRSAIAEAMDRVGIRDLARNPIDTLSGGQFQRMLFARIWLQQAPLVLLDEPFTGVDENTTGILMSLMNEMKHRGQTLMAVLHDAPRVARHFSDVLTIRHDNAEWTYAGEVHNPC